MSLDTENTNSVGNSDSDPNVTLTNNEDKKDTLQVCIIHKYGDFTIKTLTCNLIVSRSCMAKSFNYFDTLFATYPDQNSIQLTDILINEQNIRVLLKFTKYIDMSDILDILKLAENWQMDKVEIKLLLDNYLSYHGRLYKKTDDDIYDYESIENNDKEIDGKIVEQRIQVLILDQTIVYESFSYLHSKRLKTLCLIAMFYRSIHDDKNELYVRSQLYNYFIDLYKVVIGYYPKLKNHYMVSIFDKVMFDPVIYTYFTPTMLFLLLRKEHIKKDDDT